MVAKPRGERPEAFLIIIEGCDSMDDAFAKDGEGVEFLPSEISFFDLITDLWRGKAIPRHPLHRLCTLMRKMKTQSLVKERLDVGLSQELKEERDSARIRCRGNVDLTATRLTFLSEPPITYDGLHKLEPEHVLGYAIIVTLELPELSGCHPSDQLRTYLLEAVVRPPAIALEKAGLPPQPVSNYYVHNVRQFDTCVGTNENHRKLSVTGSFFTQQNNLTSVCAHAALRTAINNAPPDLLPDPKAKKLTNKMINDMLNIDFTSPERRVGQYKRVDGGGKTGLTIPEMANVVDRLGGCLQRINFLENTAVEYDQFIYPLVESSCPTILCIEGFNVRGGRPVMHAVAVLGHTVNTDRWVQARQGYGSFPIKPYFSAAEWCDHFIINDDNYGMYVTLPSDMVRNLIVPTKNPSLHAVAAFGIIPKGVTVPGYRAEQECVRFAKTQIAKMKGLVEKAGDPLLPENARVWLDRLQGDNIVCRTLLQNKREYLNYIKSLEHESGGKVTAEQQKSFQSLPEYVWVSEISLPDIYNGNKAKLGDVVIDASASKEAVAAGDSVIVSWFPGFIRFGVKGPTQPWITEKYVPFIRNIERPYLEW